MKIPETKRFIPKAYELGTTLSQPNRSIKQITPKANHINKTKESQTFSLCMILIQIAQCLEWNIFLVILSVLLVTLTSSQPGLHVFFEKTILREYAGNLESNIVCPYVIEAHICW